MDAVDLWAEMSEGMVLTAEQTNLLRENALSTAHKALAELEAATSDDDQFYALPTAAFAAFNLGLYDDARRHAERALLLSDSFQDNWNFGNAIHHGHSVLGLLALEIGDRTGAIKALHASGATRGSPQLNSFGPTMQLAIALLGLGERDAVLHYLDQCSVFWRMGSTSLSIWRRKIVAGETPNFFHHRYG